MKEIITQKLYSVKDSIKDKSLEAKDLAHSKWEGFNTSKKIVVVIIAAVTLWMMSGLFSFKTTKAENNQLINTLVRTEISKAQSKSRYIKLNGITYAEQIVNLRSEVEGLVVDIPSKKSRFVKKGETLIVIDQKNRLKALEQAEAELKREKVNFNSSKAIYDKKLSSSAAFADAKAKLLGAESNLEIALDNLDKTYIKAPFNGFLNSVNVDIGSFVTTANGNPVGSIAILDPMSVIVYIPEKDIGKAQSSTEAEVLFNKSILKGSVASLAKVAEEETRSFKMEIKVANDNYVLNAGQSVIVKVLVDDAQAHLIPKSSISLDLVGGIIVKAVDDQNNVKEYKAEIIDEEDEGFWVTGLPDMLNIITLGHQYVNNGETVEIKKL